MALLREFYVVAGLNTRGRAITRQAARGIVLRGRAVLMIHSTVNSDYKFPGGGVEPGEQHTQTIARELAEEAGARMAALGDPLGWVIEYDRPVEPDFDVFTMTSHYYFASLSGEIGGPLRLEGYEDELGFHPVWIDAGEAWRINLALLRSGRQMPRWTARDTYILGLLKQSL